jgi:hypothetical protein
MEVESQARDLRVERAADPREEREVDIPLTDRTEATDMNPTGIK